MAKERQNDPARFAYVKRSLARTGCTVPRSCIFQWGTRLNSKTAEILTQAIATTNTGCKQKININMAGFHSFVVVEYNRIQ
jgi:hypothetical protein